MTWVGRQATADAIGSEDARRNFDLLITLVEGESELLEEGKT